MPLIWKCLRLLSLLAVPAVVEAAAISTNHASCPKVSIDDGTQVTCTFSALPTAPSTIILTQALGVFQGVNQSCAGGAVTDSQGGSFTLAVESPLSTFDRALIWSRRLTVAPSGTYSITVTCPAISWITIQAFEVRGLLSASVVDQTGFASGNSADAAVQTSNPIGQGNQLVVAVLSADRSGTVVLTPSGSWTQLWEQEVCDAASGGHQCGNAVHQPETIPGATPSHAWTLNPASRWSAAIATFRGEDAPGVTNRTLTWVDNATNELRFRVQKRTNQSAPNWIDVASNLPPDTQTYIATLLSTETGDCWRVWAENNVGSNASNEYCPASSPPPPPQPPPPPGGLTISGLTTMIEDELL